ncbi:hypothetical protein [Aquisalimonas asiatica]|uniref:Uncharacterized protein n=1 Tax=Aquisalimonas asiatica TaxID=406100 RepID=A0A1H8TPR1_9GAMM|nr:hypothetical protein [Aquisalimonas asiatica]SEO92523.1 hypothetical protein SAMN04488052_104344 [Aquisalimonas asiatica]
MDARPFNASEWVTISAVPRLYGLPLDVIQPAILAGRLTVRSVAGETLLRTAELRAMRLQLMGGCRECDQ